MGMEEKLTESGPRNSIASKVLSQQYGHADTHAHAGTTTRTHGHANAYTRIHIRHKARARTHAHAQLQRAYLSGSWRQHFVL